jgi:hypothetical protein
MNLFASLTGSITRPTQKTAGHLKVTITFFGWGSGIRTPITGSRTQSPAVRRTPTTTARKSTNLGFMLVIATAVAATATFVRMAMRMTTRSLMITCVNNRLRRRKGLFYFFYNFCLLKHSYATIPNLPSKSKLAKNSK